MILGGEISCVEIPELSLAVYGLSYHAREIRDSRYNHAVPKKRQRYEILLAHGGDEKHIPLNLGKMAALGYDYVALGHIHKPWCEEGKNIAYAGALEPIDKNDTGEHGYILGEITEDGCRLRFIPCAVRKYVHLSVSVEKTMTGHALKERVREEIEKQGIQNIYKVVIEGMRDPDISFDLENLENRMQIIEIIDESEPQYDFNQLFAEHPSDMIGFYIRALQKEDMSPVEKKALFYGIDALLCTQDERS